MKRSYSTRFGRVTLLSLLFSSAFVHAQFQGQQPQETKELAPVSQTYAIKDAIVIQGPGRKLDQATVVMRDGLIVAVGKNISIPAEAIVIKGDSLYVYAGFIDGLSRVGVTKPKEDSNRERPKDPGNPDPEVAGITPQKDVRLSLNPSDKSVDELRALGFTTAQVVPYGLMLPGQSSIIQLTGNSPDKMVLVGRSSMYSELTGAQRVYPNTVIGVIAKWEELYRKAVLSKNYENLYASNRAGLNRPVSDQVLEAFYPVIDKRLPVLFESDRYLDAQRIIALQSQFGFNLMLGDIKEGWEAIPKIKSSAAKVFLSLDLPEEKKDEKKDVKKKDEAKPDAKSEPKKDEKVAQPSTFAPGEKEALEKRKEEFLAQYTGQASTFQKAGISFGFSTLSAKSADIKSNLRRMIKSGLTEDQALGALTTSAAQLLGLSDRLGSVDNGKIANLVISDKPYFHEKANVRYVFVDGAMYKYDVKTTPKGDPNAKVDIVGSWTVTTETPDSKTVQTLSVKKDGSNFSGSISGGRLPQAVNLETVQLNGNALSYSYTIQMGGQSFKVDVDATVDGTTFKGTATAGTFGSFPVEASKDPNH